MEFDELIPAQGMDKFQSPSFQMVPSPGFRYVVLNDGKGATVTSTNDSLCQVREITKVELPAEASVGSDPTARYFQLEGRGGGGISKECKVVATRDTLSAVLDIGVKFRRTKTVMLNICKGKPDPSGVQHPLSDAEIGKMFDHARDLWLDQANVEFKLYGRAHKTLDNLQDEIWLMNDPRTQFDPYFEYIQSKGDLGADLNVFCVWHIRFPGWSDDVSAETIDKVIIIATNVFPSRWQGGARGGIELAHEFGHFLGLGHRDNREALMHPTSGLTQGRLLTRADIHKANL